MKLKFWESFKGFFYKFTSASRSQTIPQGMNSWSQRCIQYAQFYAQHGLAKSMILTIAGQIVADDIFLEPSGEYDRAEESVSKCEELNDFVGMPSIIHDTVINMAKYGSCFWEKTMDPTFDVRVMPQLEYLEPKHINAIGDVDTWQLNTRTGPKPTFQVPDEVVEFHWNRSSESWPYGTSLLSGLETEFAIMAQLEDATAEYMRRNAFPKELVSVGDGSYRPSASDVSTVNSEFRNWDVGETIVTNYPLEYTAGGTGDRRVPELANVLNFVKDNITDGLMVPPISKQYNSTLASSKEMTDWAQANLIYPMRRIIERVIMRDVYQPYLMAKGFSVRVVPKILWEPPDADREENATYYSQLVMAGIMPPVVAARELGFEDEFLEWQAEEERKQQEQMQQQQLGFNNPQQPQMGEAWLVKQLGNRPADRARH